MKSNLILFPCCLIIISCTCCSRNNLIGIQDDFSGTDGWYEVLPEHDTVPPQLKLESKEGALVIHHKFRTLERAGKKWSWIESDIDYSTNLRKNYGKLDLDKYHYVVLNVKAKGSNSYFDINGFTTKLGFTTGLTVIDLKDYPDDRIHGEKKVDFGIDLQDNHTYLTLAHLKFVSGLTDKEKEKLVGKGLNIREEKLNPRPYHGLEALKQRETLVLPVTDEEEMAIFRDDATGSITTRLTATPGDDYFGEGGIWSVDGTAIKFKSQRNIKGVPIYLPGEGRVIAGPSGAEWRMWSRTDPAILYVMKRKGYLFSVFSWNLVTGISRHIADFSVPETGSYIEFKNYTPLGNIVVGFRETPHLFIIDVHNDTARYIKLPTRLKEGSVGKDEKIVKWYNCYTYEHFWLNLETGEKGLIPSFSAGHASWGSNGMVANFGGHLNIFVPGNIGMTYTPGNLISIWANWRNDIITDYGRLTSDNKYVFTNGNKGDVANQHLMIPSGFPGSVMRVARYFTKFSWTSTTYSRPSPDYTKLIYNENAIGNTELYMVYVRRPDAPVDVRIADSIITWSLPDRHKEISGYNIYGSNQSGLDFIRLNEKPAKENRFLVKDTWKFYAVSSIEHSGLESELSGEISGEKPKSFYFEAEKMTLLPPARPFFDGYCNNFQCVRINAESEEEKSRPGMIRLSLKNIPSGQYAIWARVKGNGQWHINNTDISVSTGIWSWIQLTRININPEMVLDISSNDDALKMDMILLTATDLHPKAPDPRDGIPPKKLQGLTVTAYGKQVKISWLPSKEGDLHHYSVYCGNTEDFICDNATVIRSVFKNSITDLLPEKPVHLFYKVIAIDNRWNKSRPATIKVY
ncbi:MAG: hypothetical protein GXO83_06880 [Chlorobi bacterium]|nr:hypothetical protein [Chlorobiota bacterium]